MSIAVITSPAHRQHLIGSENRNHHYSYYRTRRDRKLTVNITLCRIIIINRLVNVCWQIQVDSSSSPSAGCASTYSIQLNEGVEHHHRYNNHYLHWSTRYSSCGKVLHEIPIANSPRCNNPFRNFSYHVPRFIFCTMPSGSGTA